MQPNPAIALIEPEVCEAETRPLFSSPPAAAGEAWDGQTCNACGTPVEIADWSESAVVVCPECGQCLMAPKPWKPSLPLSAFGYLPSGRDKTKYPGSVGVAMGSFAIAAVWFFPGINPLLQWAATMLGGALLVEGIGRIRAENRRQQARRHAVTFELPQELPDNASALGSLQSVFQTHNSWGDSLAIVLFGLAFGLGGLYLLQWLGAGFLSAKLLVAAVMAPMVALYMGYRAARNLLDYRRMLLFSGGLMYIHGSRVNVYLWDRVMEITQQEIGDAIDERAIEIRLCNGRPPLRFTCAHFRNLDQFAARIQQAFAFQKAR